MTTSWKRSSWMCWCRSPPPLLPLPCRRRPAATAACFDLVKTQEWTWTSSTLCSSYIVLSEVLLYREKVHSIRRAWKKVQCQEHQSDAWRIDTWTMKMDYESMRSIYIRTVSSCLISYYLVMIHTFNTFLSDLIWTEIECTLLIAVSVKVREPV